MRPTIKIDHEQADEIVAQVLKESIGDLLRDSWVMYHSYPRSLETLDCMLHTLDYFSTTKEMSDYLKSIKPQMNDLIAKATEEFIYE